MAVFFASTFFALSLEGWIGLKIFFWKKVFIQLYSLIFLEFLIQNILSS